MVTRKFGNGLLSDGVPFQQQSACCQSVLVVHGACRIAIPFHALISLENHCRRENILVGFGMDDHAGAFDCFDIPNAFDGTALQSGIGRIVVLNLLHL